MEGILGGDLCFLRDAPIRPYSDSMLVAHESSLRLTGDLIHLSGVYSLLGSLLLSQNAMGVSLYSHELFMLAYAARYLNPLHGSVSFYRIVMALLLLTGQLFILVSMRCMPSLQMTWMRRHDTFPRLAVPVGCLVLTLIVSHRASFLEQVHWFSVMVEGLALAPQIHMFNEHNDTTHHVLFSFYMLGGYPLFYFANWISGFHEHGFCITWTAILFGVFHLSLFIVGVLIVLSPKDHLISGAMERLKNTRDKLFGLRDEGLVHHRNSISGLTAVAVAVSDGFKACTSACASILPDLEVPSSTPPPIKGQRQQHRSWDRFLKKAAKDDQQSEGMWNLLPFAPRSSGA